MRSAMWMAKVNMRLHQALATKAAVKFLGGLALGALLMTATVLPFSATYAHEPARPLSIEQIECYPEISNDCLTFTDHEPSYNAAASALSEWLF